MESQIRWGMSTMKDTQAVLLENLLKGKKVKRFEKSDKGTSLKICLSDGTYVQISADKTDTHEPTEVSVSEKIGESNAWDEALLQRYASRGVCHIAAVRFPACQASSEHGYYTCYIRWLELTFTGGDVLAFSWVYHLKDFGNDPTRIILSYGMQGEPVAHQDVFYLECEGCSSENSASKGDMRV